MCVVQAQKTVTELQAQLDLLKEAAESQQAETEDVAQLKVQCQQPESESLTVIDVYFCYLS